MGLDIYLYRYENMELTRQKEQEFEEASESFWDEEIHKIGKQKYEDLTEIEKNILRNNTQQRKRDLAKKLGMQEGEYGLWTLNKEKIEIDSKLYPEHMFKIGYFRSSYNSGGIDHLLRNTIDQELGDIFEGNDSYVFRPDWNQSLEKAKALKENFQNYVKENGCYGVIKVAYNEFLGLPKDHPIQDEKAALAVFNKTKKDHKSPSPDFASFSNRDGYFYLDKPLKVTAVITGVNKRFFVEEHLPCTYVVYERDEDYTWYLQALEIVIETIEYVLQQPDPTKYCLHWSG